MTEALGLFMPPRWPKGLRTFACSLLMLLWRLPLVCGS